MEQLHYRDLGGIGFNAEQIKAIAANGDGCRRARMTRDNPKDGPATPANQFRSPFPNEKAARAANKWRSCRRTCH